MASCSKSAYTGITGSVRAGSQTIARITLWSLDVSCEGFRFVSTDVAGWTQYMPSVRSASGTLEFKFDSIRPQIRVLNVGHCVALDLVAAELQVAIPPMWRINEAVITRCSVVVDIDRGEIVSGSMDFEANGAVLFPGDDIGSPSD